MQAQKLSKLSSRNTRLQQANNRLCGVLDAMQQRKELTTESQNDIFASLRELRPLVEADTPVFASSTSRLALKVSNENPTRPTPNARELAQESMPVLADSAPLLHPALTSASLGSGSPSPAALASPSMEGLGERQRTPWRERGAEHFNAKADSTLTGNDTPSDADFSGPINTGLPAVMVGSGSQYLHTRPALFEAATPRLGAHTKARTGPARDSFAQKGQAYTDTPVPRHRPMRETMRT
jgi:hypothetical protein